VNPLFVTCMSPHKWHHIVCWFRATCPVLELNVIYILIYLLPLSSVNLPYTCFSHSMSQISYPFSLALVTYPKTPSRSEALCHTLKGAYFLWWGPVSPMTNSQSVGPPLVGCSWLLIQYICSYPPYPQAVSYICNLRTCHGDKDSPNMLMFINPSAWFAVIWTSRHLNLLLQFVVNWRLAAGITLNGHKNLGFYSIRLDSTLICCQRNTVDTEHQLSAVSNLLRMTVLQQISWYYKNEWLPSVYKSFSPHIMGIYKHRGCCVRVICCFQLQGTAIWTLRSVGVTRNCVVQDRLIFVM
jgi:hypothetical protein